MPVPVPMPSPIPMPIALGVKAIMLFGVMLPLGSRSPLPGETADEAAADDAWNDEEDEVGRLTRRLASDGGGADEEDKEDEEDEEGDDAADCATSGVAAVIGVPTPPSHVLPPPYMAPGRL